MNDLNQFDDRSITVTRERVQTFWRPGYLVALVHDLYDNPGLKTYIRCGKDTQIVSETAAHLRLSQKTWGVKTLSSSHSQVNTNFVERNLFSVIVN